MYLSLLETVKPYVMESLRMPALPALLLFSHTLDCSGDFSIIVCDCWLELKFLSAEHAQNQVHSRGEFFQQNKIPGVSSGETEETVETAAIDEIDGHISTSKG